MLLLIHLLAVLSGLALGLLGGGGSILAVPSLVYGAGLSPRDAIASSLVIVGASSLLGAMVRRSELDLQAAWHFALYGMLGTFAGARLAEHLRQTVQLGLFAVTMLVVAGLMLSHKTSTAKSPTRAGSLPLPLASLAVGLLTGVVGVGGGFLIVPALVLSAGLSMRRAVPTSLLIIALNCAAGLLGYFGQVSLHPPFLAGFTLAVLAGVLLGGRLVPLIHQAHLKRAFALLLLFTGTCILWRNH